MKATQNIHELLPGFNCGACGLSNCNQFSEALIKAKKRLSNCPVLSQQRFCKNKQLLEAILLEEQREELKQPVGLIDHVKADFYIHPYPGEPSCRETLVCFAPLQFEKDMIIRYRPLGCPIIHFGQIIEVNYNLLDVWIVGPCSLLRREENFIDVGICMVLSFQGTIEGKLPEIGQTVKFLPAHCMMGKVHSGVIVQIEDTCTRIDCIDLKVWEHSSS